MRSMLIGVLSVWMASGALAGSADGRGDAPAAVFDAAGVDSGDGSERGLPSFPSNHCVDAPVIGGLGLMPFFLDNTTTDGLPHPTCAAFGSEQIWRDVWFDWVSPLTGSVTVATCGETSSDTRIAVYAPAAPCPPTNEYVIGCNDDACSTQSSVTFLAQAGQIYRVRVGLYGASQPAASGSGAITMTSAQSPDICGFETGPCQEENSAGNAWASGNGFRTADDFGVAGSGFVDGVCWSGVYIGPANGVDAFVITYWTDDDGFPGTPIGSFVQGEAMHVQRAYSGVANGSGQNIQLYTASHPPVHLEGGERYWIEIRNHVVGATWYWQSAAESNGALQDLTPGSNWQNSLARTDVAFCLNYLSSCTTDTNGDGQVNFADLNNVLSVFNTGCP